MGRANGKVILLGEHAVVYGLGAIAAGIERGARATARRSDGTTLRLGKLSATAGDGSDLGQALQALLEQLEAPPLDVQVELELPPGCGLGASAAIAVAIARAAIEVKANERSAVAERAQVEQIVAAATRWERVFHGNPSGIDTWAATLGGCIGFTRTEGAKSLPLGARLRLGVAVAGPPASTRQMVEQVATLRARSPEHVAAVLRGINQVVRRAEAALRDSDLPLLGRLLDENHQLLQRLGVSTPDLDHACQIAREAGALGAKLTGAGGGGAVVALLAADPAAVLHAWEASGLVAFSTEVAASAPGVSDSGTQP